MNPKFKICPHITDQGKHTFAIHRRRFFFWYSIYWTEGCISLANIVGSEKDLQEICEEGNKGLKINYWSRVDRIIRGNGFERTT